MIKKTITYTDYDGNIRTEAFYFNLSKVEVAEMEVSAEGGFSKMIENIVSAQDNKRIIEIFKEFILKSYGVKSADGKRFIKSQELRDEFSQTEAYTELFMELSNNAEVAVTFINGIIPQVAAPAPSKN